MRIIPGDSNSPRPWVITGGSLAFKVKLSTTTRRVRAGAPLIPTPTGWEVCPPDQAPWAFAADYKMPGDECTAWREIVVDMGQMFGPPGTRFKIADIGDDGSLTLETDETGPHAVLWDTYILLTARAPFNLQVLVDRLTSTQEAPPSPPPDYRNNVDLEPPASDFGPVVPTSESDATAPARKK